jgi:hypothetical protein
VFEELPLAALPGGWPGGSGCYCPSLLLGIVVRGQSTLCLCGALNADFCLYFVAHNFQHFFPLCNDVPEIELFICILGTFPSYLKS